MKLIDANDAVILSFDKTHPVKLTIEAGETITISTKDCFSNQVDENNSLECFDWSNINPATGPIYVNGAKKGDILKITIHNIELANQGVCAVGPGFGLVPFDKMVQKIIPIRNNSAIFSESIQIPLNPMIGVIGVAPAGEGIPTGVPCRHGGNMDTKLITEGSILYLPIFVDGALFALGDLHAAMGDGEVGGSGIEIAGKVIVTLEVIKGQSIEHPIVETADSFAFIVSRGTFDEAVTVATNIAVNKLHKILNISLAEAAMLSSIACNAEVSQLVDPQITARFVVPKTLMPKIF